MGERTGNRSILDIYFSESKPPLLKPEEEIKLGKLIKEGNEARRKIEENELNTQNLGDLNQAVLEGEEAKRKLILANLRLVIKIAKEYHKGHHYSVELEDLIQEGNIGLILAADKYDPDKINSETEKPHRFSTYATSLIWQAMHNATMKQMGTIRVPIEARYKIRKIEEARGGLVDTNRQQPSVEELATYTGLKPDTIRSLIHAPLNVISIEATTRHNPEKSIGDFLGDESQDPAKPNKEAVSKAINEILANLNENEVRVLEMRFGLRDGKALSYREIAEELGLSKRSRSVERLEKRALNKLKAYKENLAEVYSDLLSLE